MKAIIIIFSIACIFIFAPPATAQSEISEDDMSISILKWFYDHYPNAITSKWIKDEKENQVKFTVFFQFKEKNYQTIYSGKGKRIVEYSSIDSEPIHLTNYLYERFDQFKVKKISLKKVFPSGKTSYFVKVKTKSEGIQEIELDQSTFSNNQIANN